MQLPETLLPRFLARNQQERNNMEHKDCPDSYVSKKLDSQKSSERNFRKAQVTIDFVNYKEAVQLPLFNEKQLTREKRIIDLLGY